MNDPFAQHTGNKLSFAVIGLFDFLKNSEKAPRTDGLEVWPVLLQFGVIHVYCKKLDTHTHKNKYALSYDC